MKPKQPKRGTQEAKVLDRLNLGLSGSVHSFFIYMNINSPTKIISNLRAMGWDIRDKQAKSGSGKAYKIYWLER